MNRIILIGNGFDLAHGLRTSYGNFIDWYWGKWENRLRSSEKREEEDVLCSFRLASEDKCFKDFLERFKTRFEYATKSSFFKGLESIRTCVIKKSIFFKNICQSVETKGWVDIENEYYKLLVSCSKREIFNLRHKQLNCQLWYLQDLLIEYLKTIPVDRINMNPKIKEIIYNPINPNDISITDRDKIILHAKFWKDCDEGQFKDKIKKYNIDSLDSDSHMYYRMRRERFNLDHIYRKYSSFLLPDNILILNFNYTLTAEKYIQGHRPIIENNHIHGELTNHDSIIFGYGDELDENHKQISNLNDNEYLTHFKSIKYLESDRYRKALQFMDAAPFQVYIMGHSCGNSDRTLLNTLFEHKNCVSIKPYYYKDGNKDNYLEIVQSLSRNFTDMKLMRDRVVNKTYCEPFSFK